ncbi:MAG: alpha/beta hydrolase [Bacteroidetes bacterium]|nr:alpha/beta hydrolase [Bacteroidota bacterium]
MSENCVLFRGSRLFYYKYGDGRKFMLLFHGFGQDHRAFEPWVEKLKTEYSIISFDLFFHGASTWVDKGALKKEDWKNIILLILEKERIEKFALGAFSLGGKFALATVELFYERVERLVLVAADGIKTNFWYSLATYPILIRSLFRRIVVKPHFFFVLLKTLRSLRLVDKGLLRFAYSQMDTEIKRKRVYDSWVNFRYLKFDGSIIASMLNGTGCKVIVITGKYDKVIPPKIMNTFTELIHQKQVCILDAGHNEMIFKSTELL